MKVRLLIKKIFVITLNLCLVYTSTPIPVSYGVPPGTHQAAAARNPGSVAGTIISVGSQAMGGFLQNMAANNAQLQAQAMMSTLIPKTQPAEFFPQCPIPFAQQEFPTNACEDRISQLQPPMNQIQAQAMAQGLMDLADHYDTYYTQMMDRGQNSQFAAGLQCIDQARLRMKGEFERQVNALTARITNIRLAAQAFRDGNQDLVEDMRGINQELRGTGSQTLAEGAKDWSQEFLNDPQCAEVLSSAQGTEVLSQGNQIGLIGIRDQGVPPALRANAGNTIRDQGLIREHLNTQIETMMNDITDQGLENWISGGAGAALSNAQQGGVTQFGGLSQVLDNRARQFGIEMSQIREDLGEVGYTLPPMDRRFDETVAQFEQGSEGFFKKKFVNDCVNTSDQTGTMLSTQQILSGLRHSQGVDGGNTMSNYQGVLVNILNDGEAGGGQTGQRSTFFEDRMARLRQLDEQFGSGTVQVEYQDTNGVTRRATPYQLYEQVIEVCNTRFEQDDTFDPNNPNTASFRTQVSRAKSAITQARRLQGQFRTQLEEEIRDRVENCGGRSADRSGTCGDGTMDTAGENYCINTAVNCAGNIQACYTKIEGMVQERITVANNKANTYNANVETVIASHERELAATTTLVAGIAEQMKQVFPGSEFTLPDGLMVPMPEMGMVEELGVRLRGGSPEQLAEHFDQLPKKLEDLKKGMEDHMNTIAGDSPPSVIADYMQRIEQSWQDDKQKWADLKTGCKAKLKELQSDVVAGNDAATKAAADAQQKVGQFCRKYDNMRSNPVGGCQGENSPATLYEGAQEVAQFLDPDAQEAIRAYRNVCNRYASDSNSDDNDDSSSEANDLMELCEAKGSGDAVLRHLEERVIDGLPDDMTSSRSQINSYLSDSSGSLPSDISGSYTTAIQNLHYLKHRPNLDSTPSTTPSTPSTPATPSNTQRNSLAGNLEDTSQGLSSIAASLNALPTTGNGFDGCMSAASGVATSATSTATYVTSMATRASGSAALTERSVRTARTHQTTLAEKETALTGIIAGCNTVLGPMPAGAAKTALEATITSMTAAKDQLHTVNADFNSDIELYNTIATAPPPEEEEEESTPTTPSTRAGRSIASTREGTTDICDILDEERAIHLSTNCTAERTGTTGTATCESQTNADMEDSIPSSASISRRVNSKIVGIFNASQSSSNSSLRRDWARVGQQFSADCDAGTAVSRPTADDLGQLADTIDAAILGDDAEDI